jgi:dTDP-4-dehydrorhamnose reductase
MRLHRPPRRTLLLGGRGLLGTALIPALEGAGIEVRAPSSAELDLVELAALRRAVEREQPDLIINSAAQSRVDRAEQDPEPAFRVNAVGAHNAALAAAEGDLPLVHISTDYVFDGGRREPYREFHPTGTPPNHYGRSKLQGELLVRHSWPKHFIVRVAALYGPGRADFVDWVLASADPARPLTIVDDRLTTPTWTEDLAGQLLALIDTPCYGTYHASGHGPASWFELARRALELTDRDPLGVQPIPDAELTCDVARRAPNTALDNHLLRLRGLDTMLPWQEALARYLASAPAAQPASAAP